MKINQIIVNESSCGTSTAGSVASVAKPLGEVQKRVPVQKTVNKKGPYANSLSEGKMNQLSLDLKGGPDGLKDKEFVEKYGKTKQEMRKAMEKKPRQPAKKVDEAKLDEEDKIIAVGKGHKLKPGLLNKPENSMNPTDTVKLDVPLLIRLLEFAREDASTDMDLHDLAEKLVSRGSRGKTLSMKDYEYVVDEMSPGGVIAGGGVGEGLGDKIKKGVKNIKRGLQGWDKNAVGPGGEKLGDPKAVVNRVRARSDDELKSIHSTLNDPDQKFVTRNTSFDKPTKHSPADLQKRVIDREMKKRGLAQEGAKVDRMVGHIKKSEKKLGHSSKEAENIAWATANKRGMLDNKNKKKGK